MSIELAILITFLVFEFLTLFSITVMHFEFDRNDKKDSIPQLKKQKTDFTSSKD